MLFGNTLYGTEKTFWRDDVAGRALNGLHDDGSDLALGLILDDPSQVVSTGYSTVGVFQVPRASIAIGIGGGIQAWHKRSQLVLEVIAQQSKDPAGFSMKSTPKSDEFKVFCDGFG